MKKLLTLMLLSSAALAQDLPNGCGGDEGFSYVFTRAPIHKEPIGDAINGSNWQHFSDVHRPYNFIESEVAVKTKYGNIVTLHKKEGCAAHEPKVSPDGKRVAYALSCGTERKLNYNGVQGAMTELVTLTSELWVYDLTTNKKIPVTTGHYDRQPEWISNECMVFASNRAGTIAPQAYNGVRYPRTAWQIHKGCLEDGKLVDIYNMTPHAFYAMNPALTTKGEIAYSCWQGHVPTHNPADEKPSPNNYWNICAMDMNGANGRVMLGAEWLPAPRNEMRLTRETGSWVGGQQLTGRLALRPFAEVAEGIYCSGSYYRGNGPGEILCWSHIDVEGTRLLANIINAHNNTGEHALVAGSGLFVPPDITAVTPFAQAFDHQWPRRNEKGEWGGRTSHPAVGPNGRPIFTWGWPFCYEAIQGDAMRTLGCNRDIYMSLADIVLDPRKDAVCIACDPDWHELDGQWVAPYEERFGVEMPTIEPLTGDKCFYVVDNAKANELYDMPEYTAKIKKIRWTPYTLHTSIPNDINIGFAGEPIDATINEDGSVVQEVPCETPLLNDGLDANGVAFVHDQMLHSLRKGETRRCAGCHEQHSIERVAELKENE